MRFSRSTKVLSLGAALVGCGPGPGSPDATPPPPAIESPAAPAPAPAAPVDCTDEPGMIYIAGGEYVDALSKQKTPIKALWIDRTEVTVAAFRAFVAAGHSAPYDKLATCTWNVPDGGDLPVTCIDWYQAEAFCLWSKKRLPTAEEWSWVAEGRDERRHYPWGEKPPSCDMSVVDVDDTDDVTGCGKGRAWPVGSKPNDVTRDGVLDMLGNVAEKTSTGFTAASKSPRFQMGSNWANNPGPEPAAQNRFPMVYEAWSDKAGVRCVKDAGPQPPCTRS